MEKTHFLGTASFIMDLRQQIRRVSSKSSPGLGFGLDPGTLSNHLNIDDECPMMSAKVTVDTGCWILDGNSYWTFCARWNLCLIGILHKFVVSTSLKSTTTTTTITNNTTPTIKTNGAK